MSQLPPSGEWVFVPASGPARAGFIRLLVAELLRARVTTGDPMGAELRRYMDAGELLPDELIARVIAERISEEPQPCVAWVSTLHGRAPEAVVAVLAQGGRMVSAHPVGPAI